MKTLAIALLLCFAASLAAQAADSTGYRPGDREMFLCPTSTTLPKDRHSFGSYELFLLDYSVSPIDRFEMGIMGPFPFVPELTEYFALHAKLNYFRKAGSGSAVFAMWLPKARAYWVGNAFSLTNEHFELNIVPSIAGTDDVTLFTFMGGVAIKASERSRLMVEFITSDEWVEADVSGFLFAGWGLSGEQICWKFGGFRPLTDTGEVFMLPWVQVSWTFGGD